jgi:hypothetical protein
MGTFALQKGPCNFLKLCISPWEVSFLIPGAYPLLHRRHFFMGDFPLSSSLGALLPQAAVRSCSSRRAGFRRRCSTRVAARLGRRRRGESGAQRQLGRSGSDGAAARGGRRLSGRRRAWRRLGSGVAGAVRARSAVRVTAQREERHARASGARAEAAATVGARAGGAVCAAAAQRSARRKRVGAGVGCAGFGRRRAARDWQRRNS